MKKILLYGLFIALPTLLFAQNYTTKKTATGKAKQAFTEAMRLKMTDNTEGVLKELTAALKADPTFIDAQIQQAAAYYKLQKLADAELAFEKALKIDPNYEPEVLFSLGNIEVRQDKFGEAADHYDQYLASAKITNEGRLKAEKPARDARFASIAMKNPVPFEPKLMSDSINTPQYSEYLPTVTADGETMIFTRLFARQEDFFQSKKINGIWQKATPLEELNTDNSEGAQVVSADGNLLLFAAKDRADGLGSFDIYFSKKVNGKWSVPKGFAPINSPFWESQPSISADGRTIYFVSNRPNGLGNLDIWYVQLENGKWSEARNLGAPINTRWDDQTPFIHADNATLFFTSEGHAGMGGKDLFLSRRLSDTAWNKPENLGYPINTKENEGTLAVALDGKLAYFGRATKTDVYDIYTFDLYEKIRPAPVTYVRATVRDAADKTPLSNSKLEFVDLASQKITALSMTDEAGAFLTCLPFGKNYALNVSRKDYVFQSENFNLAETATFDKPFVLDIFLQKLANSGQKPQNTDLSRDNREGGAKPNTPSKIDETKPIVLKNVFFETNKADLRKESRVELNKLKLLLTENPAMKIEISGHTDNVGSDADNLLLSEKRAKAVRDFLVQNGIATDRLTYKGYGKTQPVDSNDTETGRAANRRTAFLILSR
jgi:outer membrane protein OmpA-like peptidoglycan-associated protein/tetratricopeptide (TPR) repeat protein